MSFCTLESCSLILVYRVEPDAAAPTDIWLWPILNGQAPVYIGFAEGFVVCKIEPDTAVPTDV